MQVEAVAWVAGIIEGEGCFSLVRNGRCVNAVIIVKMTDLDVIQRLQKVSEVGRITGPYKRGKVHWKPQWMWRVTKRADLLALCHLIRPWLCSRRTRRMAEILSLTRKKHDPEWVRQLVEKNGTAKA